MKENLELAVFLFFVVLAVAWSPEAGWVVSVADAGEIDYQRDEIPDAAAAEAQARAQDLQVSQQQ